MEWARSPPAEALLPALACQAFPAFPWCSASSPFDVSSFFTPLHVFATLLVFTLCILQCWIRPLSVSLALFVLPPVHMQAFQLLNTSSMNSRHPHLPPASALSRFVCSLAVKPLLAHCLVLSRLVVKVSAFSQVPLRLQLP